MDHHSASFALFWHVKIPKKVVRFFEADTWVFLLAAFTLFYGFCPCTTAKSKL
jgi:hypothetical protein